MLKYSVVHHIIATTWYFIFRKNVCFSQSTFCTYLYNLCVLISVQVQGEIQEIVKTGLWVGDCFIYTSSVNRLNYYVGGEIVTIAHLDRYEYREFWLKYNQSITCLDCCTGYCLFNSCCLSLPAGPCTCWVTYPKMTVCTWEIRSSTLLVTPYWSLSWSTRLLWWGEILEWLTRCCPQFLKSNGPGLPISWRNR